MDSKFQASQTIHPRCLPPLSAPDPRARRKPAGRKPNPCLDSQKSAEGIVSVIKYCFPFLNSWLNQLPDPRCLVMCRYAAAHIWWQIIATYLSRSGSRNAFDEKRNTGAASANMGQLCGQDADDPRFDGEPTVTCSDNAWIHARRVDAQCVRHIPLRMIKTLIKRRMFDSARLLGNWYPVIVDGTVQEKCRKGFGENGKSGSGSAPYRYVLQALLLGPDGNVFSFMHESMDMHDPIKDKEDCELKAFLRLSQRVKEAFPRLPICWVGDALYACQTAVEQCRKFHWKYIFTVKEGRQPTLWSEVIKLLPLSRPNRTRVLLGSGPLQGRLDCRWVENVMLGSFETQVILAGEMTAEASILYAFITNFSHLNPERVLAITDTGRQRHRIEDTFNSEKNHGIGLEHVFCADDNAAKNYYTMMQVAQIIWVLFCHGYCKRVYQWARRATEQGLARCVWEGLRAHWLPPDLPPIGQIRFGFT